MRLMLLAAAAALAVPLAAIPSLPAVAQQAVSPALAAVLAHSRRDADRVRDQHRHPGETLAFFQIEPGMTVVDYVPDQGWYTRIIAPYLGPNGRYIAMGPDVSAERLRLSRSRSRRSRASPWRHGRGRPAAR